MRKILVLGLFMSTFLAGMAVADGRVQRFAIPEQTAAQLIIEYSADAPCFDPNGDAVVDSADFFYLLNYIYQDGPPPIGNGDANGDGAVDPADIFYLYAYLYEDGPAPIC